MAPFPQPRQSSATDPVWVSTALAAELLGISERAVRDRCAERDWRTRRGGVALESLPADVQLRALRRLADDGAPGGSALARRVIEPEVVGGSRYERASASEKTEADRRLGILHQWWAYRDASGEPRAATKLLVQFVGALRCQGVPRVSKSSLYAWEAAYAARRLDGLVPSYGGGRETEVSPQDRSLFLQCWGTEQQPALTVAYHAYLILRPKASLPGTPATLGQMRYLVDHLTEEERIMLRCGPRGVRSLLLPYIQRDWDGCLPLEWWCLDHTPLDLLALDEDSGKVCRPYLTTLMDMGTRRGCVTVCRTPNQRTVLWTIAKAMLAWGTPGNLYVDNGKDFRSSAVTGGKKKRLPFQLDTNRCRSLCERLQISAHFATSYNAQAKPVERWHRTIEQNLAVIFESYVGNRPDKKPEALKDALKAGEIPTFRQIEQIVTGWIEGVYHQTGHAGLHGKTPDQVWAERIGQVQVVQRTREELRYLLLSAPKPVTVARNQIRLFGRSYEAAAETPDCLFGFHGRRVWPHYDPRDITRVFLALEDETPIGWVTEKRLFAIGPVAQDAIAAARIEQKRVRQALQTHLADVAATLIEPDRVLRKARELQDQRAGREAVGSLPPAPVTRPRLIALPLVDATKAAAALAATPPARPAPRDAAAEHQDAMDDILTAAESEALPPPAADDYDAFIREVTG